MKKIALLIFLFSTVVKAQDYDIYIHFDKNEFTSRWEPGPLHPVGEYFSITPKFCCDDSPIYSYRISQGIIKKVIKIKSNTSSRPKYLFSFKGKTSLVKKNKIRRTSNVIKSEEIAKSVFSETLEILRNASNIYILIEDAGNSEYYIKYTVTFHTS